MSNWKLRQAKQADAVALAECIDRAYSIYANRILDLPPVSEGIAEDIEKGLVWIAERGNRVIGGLVLIQGDSHIKLANIAVSPNATGIGLGKALMQLAEAETLKRGFDELRLSTHIEMPENVRLYEHLGWREIGRSRNKVQMAKSIEP